jgi:hypothetical protein
MLSGASLLYLLTNKRKRPGFLHKRRNRVLLAVDDYERFNTFSMELILPACPFS